ncbi:cation-transporting P-type ATPase [Patescibacteria group bacterium]|nr:cation-transporting P-type ATPase [Patescibacteria group bacterium]MBU1015550.1 cation-transporting P-type ATPase [Patescibacteria group bacterium]MBU1685601.1 cation-transporting P-type ATPase [Patescibacteria group bacterium]MBU1938981.1 cation-transporting P-type ATPase [Patescibacteria group bacterium]
MPTKNPKQYFYQFSAEEAIQKLRTDGKKGLTQSEAEKRLTQYGHNELKEGKRRPMIFRFFDQFKDLLIIVLIVAAFLAYYLGDFRGGTILLVIVFVNSVIGFYQEYKAEKILESLKRIIQAKAIVIREGKRLEVDQFSLVPGDLIYLEEGGSVPADVRLTETTNFSTNDFVLTGESVPQEKWADLIIDHETTLTNQDNSVFMGLTVAKGNAYGVVYGTGMDTAIGRIAKQTESIHHDLSPLQREINILAKSLTKIAGVIALSLFIINFFLNVGEAESIRLSIQLSILFAISVAAACVPQGLPAQISVALSLGVGRLAKKKAVVKKLSSVETLGSTTVICSDKTGTLTKNEMTITHCVILDCQTKKGCEARVFETTGEGYEPKGSVLENGKKIDKKTFEFLKQFFEDGFLASNGRVEPPDKNHRGWYAIGDPTEAAFTPLAMKVGLKPADLDKRFPLFHELPFDSDRKRMTIIRQHKGKHIGYMKGAIESILTVCDKAKIGGEIVPLTDGMRKSIMKQGDHFSAQALRVIALAYRDFPKSEKTFSIKKTEKNFIFSGFVTMIDPPRLGVKEAIERVYKGGMRVMMITGDNEITAKAIAERIGMKHDDGELPVYNGDQIKRLSDQKLKKILKARSVIFSRVSPQDKYRLVTLLKQMGEVVAVTGDGVNDTLSLKRSDIGVAMGKMGSEVAKEASEIVLLDDNFSTLTRAIGEGRTIFANLRHTILSSITSNNGELTCVLLGFIGVAFGLPAPITAVQILAIDLVGEMLPLTAMTFDPPEKTLMEKPPRDLKDHIINRQSYLNLIFYGFWMGAAGFFSFFMVYKFGSGTVESARAAAYTGIIFCQFMNILSRRSERTIFTRHLFTNPQLWGSFVISLIVISLLIYIPSLSIWFGFGSLTTGDLTYPLIGAVAFLILHETGKLFNFLRP